jgi:hypothetical protein
MNQAVFAFVPFVFNNLTQIREHIAAVIVVPQAGLVERLELSCRKGRSRDRQSDGLVKALEAGQAYSSLFRLIRMFITISTTAFHTGSERRIVAAMRD